MRIQYNISFIIISLFLFNCQPSIKSDVEEVRKISFKGMELYSWVTDGGEWKYTILIGTNRYKSLDEVINSPMSIEEIKTNISKMVSGESIFWFNLVKNGDEIIKLDFPSDEIISALKLYASQYNLNLIIQSNTDSYK